MTIISGVLTVQAVDPNAPTELNQWSYTAGVVGPSRPVDYGDDVEALGENLFSVNEDRDRRHRRGRRRRGDDERDPGRRGAERIVKRNVRFDPNMTMYINVEGEAAQQVHTDISGRSSTTSSAARTRSPQTASQRAAQAVAGSYTLPDTTTAPAIARGPSSVVVRGVT